MGKTNKKDIEVVMWNHSKSVLFLCKDLQTNASVSCILVRVLLQGWSITLLEQMRMRMWMLVHLLRTKLQLSFWSC